MQEKLSRHIPKYSPIKAHVMLSKIIDKLKGIQSDLYQHFSVGVISFVLMFIALSVFKTPLPLCSFLSFLFVFIIACFKEKKDASTTGFNWLDIAATVSGGLIVFLLKVLL